MRKAVFSRSWLILIQETILTNSWAPSRTIISKKLCRSPKILMLKMFCHNFHQKLPFQELAVPLGLKDLDLERTTRASINLSPRSKIWTKNVAWRASSTPRRTCACNPRSASKLRSNPKYENTNKAKLINSNSHTFKASCINKINHKFWITKTKTSSAPRVISPVQKLSIWTIPPAIQEEKLTTIKPSRAT